MRRIVCNSLEMNIPVISSHDFAFFTPRCYNLQIIHKDKRFYGYQSLKMMNTIILRSRFIFLSIKISQTTKPKEFYIFGKLHKIPNKWL